MAEEHAYRAASRNRTDNLVITNCYHCDRRCTVSISGCERSVPGFAIWHRRRRRVRRWYSNLRGQKGPRITMGNWKESSPGNYGNATSDCRSAMHMMRISKLINIWRCFVRFSEYTVYDASFNDAADVVVNSSTGSINQAFVTRVTTQRATTDSN